MKKKLLITSLLATTLAIPTIMGLTACDGCKEKNGSSARDAYAMFAVSSISYLAEDGGNARAMRFDDEVVLAAPTSQEPATARPEELADSDIVGMKNCLSMFDGMIAGGGFEQTIKDNSSQDPLVSGYPLEMTISLHNGLGEAEEYKMYFREVNTQTEKEIDEEKEVEVSTTFEGVVVYGGEYFVVEGEREVETEGNETETEIEFITYKNVGTDEIEADRNNYVVVEQSFENTEVEYEYTLYENGRKVQELEIEYEEEKNGTEVSFAWKDLTTGVKNETEYTVRKGTKNGAFVITYEKNGAKSTIDVEVDENGSYTFVYGNGYQEVVA